MTDSGSPLSPSPSGIPGHLPLRYGCFRLTFKPATLLRLPPYPGSLFRGAFGWALKRVICVTHTHDCPPCFLRDRCLFPYIFETPPPASATVMRKYTTAPHPFVLDPPFPHNDTITPEQSFSLNLTLVGHALSSLPYFIFAFEQLGRTGLGRHRTQCTLDTVDTHLAGQSWTLYSLLDKVLRPGQAFEQSTELDLTPAPLHRPSPARRIRLELCSPLRLVFQERLMDKPEFHMIIRTLLRRIALLSTFHCDGASQEVAFRDWIDLAQQVRTVSQSVRWFDWERYSFRQRTPMRLGGLLGSITFEGPITPFLPLLQVGEIVHLGKGTSFGLGRYRLAMENENRSALARGHNGEADERTANKRGDKSEPFHGASRGSDSLPSRG